MYNMFCLGMSVNHDNIKVYDNELSFHWVQNTVHYVHELIWGICSVKRQDSPRVQVKYTGEGCLLSVHYCNENLVIAGCQVQCSEQSGAMHGVEEILNMWQRITAFDSYGI
jgi:hypothetical protein